MLSIHPKKTLRELERSSLNWKVEELNKTILTNKLKAVRIKFPGAVDSGRKSGHGRVVLLYLDKCEEIWGGSPATTTLPTGFETNEIKDDSNSSVACSSPASCARPTTPSTSIPGTPSSTTDVELFDPNDLDDKENGEPSSVNDRRELLNSKLRSYRKDKLKRKLSTDVQLLDAVQEYLAIKKRLMEKMEDMDKQQAAQMNKFATNMEHLTGSIVEGFAMLRQIMVRPVPSPFSTPLTGYNNTWNRQLGSQQMNMENNTFPYSQFTNDNFNSL